MAPARFPWLLYALPLLAVAVLIFSVFFAAGDQRIRSALVLGGPTLPGAPFRGRLQVVEEQLGVIHPRPAEKIRLRSTSGRHEASRLLTTDAEGWVEFEVPGPRDGGFHLEVLGEDGAVLAEGEPTLSAARWAASARERGGESTIQRQGALAARVLLESRVLSVPFEGKGTVVVTSSGKPLVNAAVLLSSEGASLTSAHEGATDARGEFAFRLRPQQHVASLRVIVTESEHRLEFDQLLPVVPGSFSFKQERDGLRVLSPIPRETAWFTFVRKNERLHGGRIKLVPDKNGGATGLIPHAVVPELKGTYLVLASEADGRSPSTVGFPLDGQGHTFDAWDAYLLDGAPAVRAQVLKRQRRVRWSLGGYAALSGLLTLVLFVSRVRRADRELTSRLKDAGATETTGDNSALPVLIPVVCLFFAFSLAVVWIVAR